jgi:hypothetical protein
MYLLQNLFAKLIRETQDLSMLKLLCHIWALQGGGMTESIPGLSWTVTDYQEPKVWVSLVEQGELFGFVDDEEEEMEEDAEDWCEEDNDEVA